MITIDYFGRWSYGVALLPYGLLLVGLVWRFRVILSLERKLFFLLVSSLLMLVLGWLFEWVAGVLRVWTFPPESNRWSPVLIPVFGWISGHRVPVEELAWIAVVVPLFYYLWLWATLVFCDIIYVVDLVDGREQFYKREERWVGFLGATRISRRRKGERGRENETALLPRAPGFIARSCARWRGA